jgi:predicted DNA-binding transcriptional regulator AlpA
LQHLRRSRIDILARRIPITTAASCRLSAPPATNPVSSSTGVQIEQMSSKLTPRRPRRAIEGAAPPHQLPLLLISSSSAGRSAPAKHLVVRSERLGPLDQRMSTAEVLRVVGVNRSTLFRWTKRGRFPRKHVSGGWLRSDVERWLAEKIPTNRPRSCSPAVTATDRAANL